MDDLWGGSRFDEIASAGSAFSGEGAYLSCPGETGRSVRRFAGRGGILGASGLGEEPARGEPVGRGGIAGGALPDIVE